MRSRRRRRGLAAGARPVSADLGLTGRAFVDVGGLGESTNLRDPRTNRVVEKFGDNLSPRVGAGIGVSWRSPFGLINVDLAQAVVKQRNDQTQLFRFGFGTRF